jgi:DNA ligase D-like protein (predicted 3'-phosphoesterase)
MTKSKFIVVEHDAKKARLHWDLRFKMPNSQNWASFAVRKGIPLNPGQKVLAIRTHDHTEKEALFLGVIDDGYGAGNLKKWDDGQCVIHKYSPSHIAIEFKGRKVKGLYHLINTGVMNRKDYKKQEYMLFKGKIVTENFPDSMGIGMNTRLPPADTTEVEISDEEQDKQVHKLPWTKRISTIGTPHYSQVVGGFMSRMAGPPDSEDDSSDNEEKLSWSKRKISIGE